MDDARIRLTRSPLDLAEALRCVSGSEAGGIALFVGTVRALEEGRPIGGIGYEAYESMALKELAACAAKAERRHGAKVAVFHRFGPVPVGEASVVVAAAAPHRAQAFSACREAIDSIKENVPIWKSSFLPSADRAIPRGSVTEPSGEGMPLPDSAGERPASEGSPGAAAAEETGR